MVRYNGTGTITTDCDFSMLCAIQHSYLLTTSNSYCIC